MAVPPLSIRDRLPLSKRAAMERLPIHLNPSMWRPEELMEVFRTPKLLEMLRTDPVTVKLSDGNEISRFEAGILALQKAGIRMRDLMPRGPEKWLEHGTFALTWGGDALGFYRTREHAERARNRVVSDLAKGKAPAGMPGILGGAEHLISETAIEEYWPDHPEEEYDEDHRVVWRNSDGSEASRKDVRRYESIQHHAWSRTTKELEGLRHDTMGAPMRKRLAEGNTKVVQVPKQLADSDYSEGDEPLEIDRAKAARIEADPEIGKALEKEWPETGWDRNKKIFRPIIETVKKRIKALEEGVDPSKLSDDGVPLPQHTATKLLPISKLAQDPVRRTAESILKIIHFVMFRVPQKDKAKFLQRIRGKIQRIPAGQVSIKKLPQTAAIGQAISLTKNILSGLNPFFVKRVIDELANMMLTEVPGQKPSHRAPTPRPPGA